MKGQLYFSNKLIKFIFTIIILFSSSYFLKSQNNIFYSPPPSWITEIKIPLDSIELEKSTDGFYYLLFDRQYNIAKSEIYTQFAIRLDSYESVDEQSTLEISYNPDYQKLEIHYIEVIRDGISLNRLKKNDIEFLRTEEERYYKIYNGNITASIHLRDVQTEDIIHYAYTISGNKPLFTNYFSTSLWFQFAVPIEQVHYRIICPRIRKLNLNYENHSEGLYDTVIDNNTVYLWTKKKIPALYLEDQTPSWYNPYPTVYISEWQSWEELVKWALDLYPLPTYKNPEIQKTVSELVMGKDSIDGITSIIRYVQNDIRYLGIMEGDFSHKPRNYVEIYDKRYGDCKEKTHLLRSMLWYYGVKSYPVLTNTQKGYTLPLNIPDHNAFNHAILAIEWHGNFYFIDPTISNQSGSLTYTDIPNYYNGLMIKKGEKTIRKITTPDYGIVDILCKYHIYNSDSTSLSITTTFSGISADYLRAKFANMNIKMIGREYLKSYSKFYPEIELLEDISYNTITNDNRSLFVVNERYIIKNLGIQTSETSGFSTYSFYALEINEYLTQVYSKNRKMFFGFTFTGKYNQTIVINNINNFEQEYSEKRIDEAYMAYKSTTEVSPDEIIAKYSITFFRHYILPTEYESYYNNLKEMQEDMALSISILNYEKAKSHRTKFYFLAFVISFSIIFISIVIVLLLYYKYDPNPQISLDRYNSFGGWLILPMIGLFVSPFTLGYSLLEYYKILNTDIMPVFTSGLLSSSELIKYGLFVFADVANNIFALIFCIFLIIIFLKKRTSFPMLIIGFFSFTVLMSIYEVWALHYLDAASPEEIQTSITDLGRAIFGAIIWIPYFLLSKRVKGTFRETLKPQHVDNE